MKQIDVNELKEIELEILDTVSKFCDEYEINYWLDCGTLLGAVRHKGYIPWDDDIDIGMLRPDYEKFTKLFNQYNTRYKFMCYELNENFYIPFGKVIDTQTILYEPDEKGRKFGVYIDIFIYDNAPDNNKILACMFKKRDIFYYCNFARQARIFQPPQGNILRRLIVYAFRSITRIFPRNYFVKKLVNNSKRYVNADTVSVGNFFSMTTTVTYNKDMLSSFVEIEFEGKRYKVPARYEEYLHEMYGDYMKLPPEEKRVSTHIFKAYKIGPR